MAYVLDYLQGRGAAFTVIPHAHGATATEEARAIGMPEGEVVTTLVVMTHGGPALTVIPASETLDLERARDAVGDDQARLATEAELARLYPDYELGTLPPLAMLLLVPMYVDPAVAALDQITFAAGRQDVSIRMASSDLFGTDPIVIAPLTTAHTAPIPGAWA